MQLIYEYRGQRHTFDLKNGRMMIGRGEGCDLNLQAEGVSSQHVLLEIDGDFVELFDQQSTHGTRVNGRPVKNHILAPGDRIRVGAVQMMLQDAANPVPIAPPQNSASQARSRSSTGRRSAANQRSGASARSKAASRSRPGPSGASVRGVVGGGNPLLGRFQLRNVDSDEVYVLVRNLETLGSREKNSIVLTGNGISRYHCKVEVKDGCWRVKDLESRNGILFSPNAENQPQRVPEGILRPGSRVQIGDVLLVFEERDAHLRPAQPAAPNRPASASGAQAAPAPNLADGGGINPALGAVVVVGILALVGLLFYASTANTSNPNKDLVDESFTSYEERIIYAMEKLIAGDGDQARRIMEDVNIEFRDRKATPPLTTIVKIWDRRSKDMEIDGWDQLAKAFEILEGVNVPLKIADFVKKNSAQVRINRDAIKLFAQAKKHVDAGHELRSQNQVLKCCQEFYKALTILVRVNRKSIVGDDAVNTYKSVRLAAYDSLAAEAERHKQAQNWTQARDFYSYARAYAPDKAAKKSIEKAIVLAGQNRLDESNYERALRLIGTKNPDNYGRAMELLRSVRSDSAISESAKAWLNYAQRDFYARRATQFYRAGKGEKALQFIEKALAAPGLKAPERSRLTDNRAKWKKVVQAFKDGETAIGRGEFAQATKEFESVIANVNLDRNAYGRLAQAKLDEISKRKNMSADEIFKEAQTALESRDYELLHTMLSRLRSQTGGRGALFKKAVIMVDKHERKFDLVNTARKVLFRKKSSQYAEQLRVTKVLKEFLPTADPRRRKASDVYLSLLRLN